MTEEEHRERHYLQFKIEIAKELYVNWLSHDDPEKLEPRIDKTELVIDLAFHLANAFSERARKLADKNYENG